MMSSLANCRTAFAFVATVLATAAAALLGFGEASPPLRHARSCEWPGISERHRLGRAGDELEVLDGADDDRGAVVRELRASASHEPAQLWDREGASRERPARLALG